MTWHALLTKTEKRRMSKIVFAAPLVVASLGLAGAPALSDPSWTVASPNLPPEVGGGREAISPPIAPGLYGAADEDLDAGSSLSNSAAPSTRAPSLRLAMRPEPSLTQPRNEDALAPSYVMGGVVISSGLRKALLRSEPRQVGRWVSEGETTQNGWVITTIKPDGVILARGARKHAIPLHGPLQ
jgi:hypothetical protein